MAVQTLKLTPQGLAQTLKLSTDQVLGVLSRAEIRSVGKNSEGAPLYSLFDVACALRRHAKFSPRAAAWRRRRAKA